MIDWKQGALLNVYKRLNVDIAGTPCGVDV